MCQDSLFLLIQNWLYWMHSCVLQGLIKNPSHPTASDHDTSHGIKNCCCVRPSASHTNAKSTLLRYYTLSPLGKCCMMLTHPTVRTWFFDFIFYVIALGNKYCSRLTCLAIPLAMFWDDWVLDKVSLSDTQGMRTGWLMSSIYKWDQLSPIIQYTYSISQQMGSYNLLISFF